jgi:hypothetical protein
MTLWGKVQVGLLTVVALAFGWQLQQHLRQSGELAFIAAQVRTTGQELESRGAALAASEQRNLELSEAERRAGNQTLLALMRERSAVTLAASKATSEVPNVGGALAKVLASSEQWETEREYLRNEMRSSMGLFFRTARMSPEKIDEYLDMEIEMKRRAADRMAGLLRGTTAVADAVRQRDQDRLEEESRRREALGSEGSAFFESIGDGMRNTEAKRLLSAVQQNMGGNELNREQSDRLQGLLKAEFCTLSFDDTDLFRPPAEWAQVISERQQNVLNGIAAYLTPAQVETLKALGAYDLAERMKEMMQRRKSLGIK